MPLQRKKIILIAVLLAVLTVSMVVGMSAGAVGVPVSDILPALSKLIGVSGGNWSSTEWILAQLRIPRVILSALVGMALAVSGAILQGLFRNPLAEPYVAGVSVGAALGATVVILFGFGLTPLSWTIALPAAAFVGALSTTLLVQRVARVGPETSVATLLLAGLAISSLFSAVISLLMVLKGKDLEALIFWLMGGLAGRTWQHVGMITPILALGFPLALFYARDLNACLLGDERAKQLGVDVERVKRVLILLVALLTGAAVSVSGMIGFVGLMVPHLVRFVTGPDHRFLLPGSALAGASFLVLSDLVSRMVLIPREIPVGIVTAIFGAPFFIYLLRTRKRVPQV